MGEILLFNIHDPEKRTAIRLTAMRLGIPCREIPREQQGITIAELLSAKQTESFVAGTESFEEELMLMNALRQEDFRKLLDLLRNEGQIVRLKAVVTEHNRNWTPTQLCKALKVEEDAIRRRIQQKEKPQHRKKK